MGDKHRDNDVPKRRLHAYCVGQAKSGTASLWGLCRTHFKAAHEPERSEILAKVLEIESGDVSDQEVVDWLLERDQRLQLDVDVSWCYFFLLEHLLSAFPSAKFVILVRDCYTWMESVIGHMLTREIPEDAREFMEFWFKTSQHPHDGEDEKLKEQRLFSLRAYLHTWREHIETTVATIPADRRVVIRTHELIDHLPELAQFLDVGVEEFDLASARLNVGTWQGRIDEFVAPSCVEAAAKEICGDAMKRFFPEVESMGDAYQLWSR